jgi:hypothetical protein
MDMHATIEELFSMWSNPSLYVQWEPAGQASWLRVNSWSNELVVRRSSAGKDVSMEEEDTVGICYQEMTGEETVKWEDFRVCFSEK